MLRGLHLIQQVASRPDSLIWSAQSSLVHFAGDCLSSYELLTQYRPSFDQGPTKLATFYLPRTFSSLLFPLAV